MACYKPLHRFILGPNPNDLNKSLAKVTSGDINYIRFGRSIITNYEEIPCGQCIGCRLDYSRTWAIRCCLEARKYEDNCMLTLTYDDEHVPRNKGCDLSTGEVKDVTTLKPDDVTLFLKRLRKKHQFRYFYCGEYGESTSRAHYHMIIFGFKPDDLVEFKRNKKGFMIYLSQELSDIWQNGYVTVSDFCYESAAYVARYVVKKIKGPQSSDVYSLRGQVPEFVRMSRRPGIAFEYYQDNFENIFKTNKIWLNTSDKLVQVKPPRYYEKLFDVEHSDDLEKLKQLRKELAESRELARQKSSDLSTREYREMREKLTEFNVSKLKRSYELD